MPPPQVLILDDNPNRIAAMRRVLNELLPRHEVVAFDNAPQVIESLETVLPTTELICLDHDLGPTRRTDGQTLDPGCGRDIADALAARPPTAPVIVHSTNAIAVPGMLRVLRDTGWYCARVVPDDELTWIERDWRFAVARTIASGWFSASS